MAELGDGTHRGRGESVPYARYGETPDSIVAAIEAMRAGKAVIASNVGGLPEVVHHGVTGILIPTGNIATWTRTIESADAHELAAMGKQAREAFLQEFSVDRCELELSKIYTSCRVQIEPSGIN